MKQIPTSKRLPKILSIIFFLALLSAYGYTFATPPGSPYQPAETLDPTCTPGSTNCFVRILPDQTGHAGEFLTTNGSTTSWAVGGGGSQWTTNGSNIYYNAGNVGVGTTSPAFALHVSTTSPSIYGAAIENFSSSGYGLKINTASTSSSEYALMIYGGNGANQLFKVRADGAVAIPQLTTGSVPFAGTGGIISQDNANLFWNDSSKRLGIGTTVPVGPLQVAPLQYNTGTASQSGTTVTGFGTSWTSSMIGNQFIFANGSMATITAVGGSTSLTLDAGASNSVQAYSIHYPGLVVQDAGNLLIGATSNPNSNSRIYVYGGANGANIDARGSPGLFKDISQFEAEGNNYDVDPNSLSIRYFGSTATGSQTIMGYASTKLGVLDFINNTTSLIRSNTSIHFGGGLSDTVAMTLDTVNKKLGIGNINPGELLTLGTPGTTGGIMSFAGSTSGKIIIQPQAAAGTYNFNLPITAGTAGQVLTSEGGGATAMTWTTPTTFTLADGSGTTANGTAVDLGGTVTSDTLINLGSNDFILRTNGAGNGAGLFISGDPSDRFTQLGDVQQIGHGSLFTIRDGDDITFLDNTGHNLSFGINTPTPSGLIDAEINGRNYFLIDPNNSNTFGIGDLDNMGNHTHMFLDDSSESVALQANDGQGLFIFPSVSFLGDYNCTASCLTLVLNDAGNSGSVDNSAHNLRFGFGTTSAASTLETAGSFGTATKTVTIASLVGPLSVQDHTIFCDATGGTVSIELPAVSDSYGRIYTIKKEDGGLDPCFISAAVGDTIENQLSYQIDEQYATIEIQADRGNNWHIISNGQPQSFRIGGSTVTDGATLLTLQDTNSVCTFTANTGVPACGSDRTLKKDISSLDTVDLLTRISSLNPVSYHWLTEDSNASLQHGFIAQEVAEQFPDLVTEQKWIDGTTRKFLNTGGLMPYVVGAVKELSLTVKNFSSLDTSNTASLGGLMKQFLANASNGISDLYAKIIHSDRVETKTICVADDTGSQTCITKAQLDALLQSSGTSGSSYVPPQTPTPPDEVPPTDDADETPDQAQDQQSSGDSDTTSGSDTPPQASSSGDQAS